MDSKKYIGVDVHKESISIAVRNGAGKIVMECVIETNLAAGPFLVAGSRSTHHAIARSGWARSRKPVCDAERSSTTNNWTLCGLYANKCGKNYGKSTV
jgi:hypothetical protein